MSNKTKQNKSNGQVTAPTAESQVATIPAGIGAPEGEETAVSLPVVGEAEPQVEPEKPVQVEGEKKGDGRGRPKGMILSFEMTVGELLATTPELGGLWHCISEKRARSGEQIQALIAAKIASDGVGALSNPEFLASLASEEIGENLQIKGREKTNENGEKVFVDGYLEKYGPDFKVEVSRGQIHKYFDNRKEGVFHRLTEKTAAKAAAVAAEAAKGTAGE